MEPNTNILINIETFMSETNQYVEMISKKYKKCNLGNHRTL